MREIVALLAEGVDRNESGHVPDAIDLPVALLAEGVDRNFQLIQPMHKGVVSPSSRRAWIEI